MACRLLDGVRNGYCPVDELREEVERSIAPSGPSRGAQSRPSHQVFVVQAAVGGAEGDPGHGGGAEGTGGLSAFSQTIRLCSGREIAMTRMFFYLI